MPLFIIFLFLTSSVFAQNKKSNLSYCSDVRLDQGDSAMAKTIETSQVSGTCYAHAGILLYDTWRYSNLKNNQPFESSSPASAAYIYKKIEKTSDVQKTGLDGGHLDQLLNILKTNSPCPIKKTKLENSNNTYTDSQEEDFNFLWDGFNELETRIKKTPVSDSLKIKKAYASYCSDINSPNLQLQSKTKSFKQIVDIVKNNKVYKVLKDAKYFECKNKNRAPDYTVNTFEKNNGIYNDQFLKNISKQLDQKPKKLAQPVSISFCSYKAYGKKGTVGTKGNKDDDCGPHGAVIIGKRIDPKTNKCQFLILDSSLENTINTKYRSNISTKSQKAWVDATSLVTHTFEMNYLSP